MSRDHIYAHVAHLGPGAGPDNPEAILPVPASGLREHFATMSGLEMPGGDHESQLGEDLFASLTQLSQDETLYTTGNPAIRLMRVVKLGAPLVDATTRIGQYIDAALSPTDSDAAAPAEAPRSSLNNLLYFIGLHDIASFAIANTFELHHPRLENTTLLERSQALSGEGRGIIHPPAEEVPSIVLAAALLGISRQMQHKLKELTDAGKTVIDKSQGYLSVLRAVTDSQDESGKPPS